LSSNTSSSGAGAGLITPELAVQVFLRLPAAVMITTTDGTIVAVNPAFSRITGYERDEIVGKNPRILKSGYHDAAFYESFWATVRRTGQWQGEIWNRRPSGEVYPEWLTLVSVRNAKDERTHYVAIFSDIAGAKQADEAILRRAHYDPLTDVPNRLLFQDRMKQALARSRRVNTPVAILFMDLDGFKSVNDRFGHALGDLVLKQVARRLSGAVREGDTVARMGGDEFVILWESATHESVRRRAQQIIDLIGEPMVIAGHSITTGTSIGIALFPNDGVEPESLLRRADEAMYHSKRAGGGRFTFAAATSLTP
jgi:diguanylate cyclase (GGDEF)-like protein/PAS domain S-box-containing protein